MYEVDINNNHDTGSTEILWMEASVQSQKLLIGTFYCPPNDKHFIKLLEPSLHKISHRAIVILLGDFNIGVADNKPLSSAAILLRSVMSSHNFTNIIKDPTRITCRSCTLIDHIYVTNTSRVSNSGSFDSCISDHNLVFTTYNLKSKRKPPKLITIKDYKNINMDVLRQDLDTSPWDLIDLFDEVDDALWCWETIFKGTLSQHVKTRKVNIRSDNNPG